MQSRSLLFKLLCWFYIAVCAETSCGSMSVCSLWSVSVLALLLVYCVIPMFWCALWVMLVLSHPVFCHAVLSVWYFFFDELFVFHLILSDFFWVFFFFILYCVFVFIFQFLHEVVVVISQLLELFIHVIWMLLFWLHSRLAFFKLKCFSMFV